VWSSFFFFDFVSTLFHLLRSPGVSKEAYVGQPPPFSHSFPSFFSPMTFLLTPPGKKVDGIHAFESFKKFSTGGDVRRWPARSASTALHLLQLALFPIRAQAFSAGSFEGSLPHGRIPAKQGRFFCPSRSGVTASLSFPLPFARCRPFLFSSCDDPVGLNSPPFFCA